jgi:RNA polymerase sigma-70 factor (ECF subfamily)
MRRVNIKTSDEILISQFIGGNDYAFEVLLKKYKKKARNLLYPYIGNDPIMDDVLQEATIKISKHIKQNKYVENGKFLNLLTKTAYNSFIDHYRKKKKSNTISINGLEHIIEQISDNSNDKELVYQDLIKASKQLSNDQQLVIKLHYLKGLKYKEIANLMGISVNTVLGIGRYAIINLRKICKKENII